MGLAMVLALHGVQLASQLASLPPGVPVPSLRYSVSSCYRQRNCSSVFFNDSTKKCHLSTEVYFRREFTSKQNEMQYFLWRRDDCDKDYTWYRSLGLCYKMYTSTKTWFQANHTCHQDGGHLIKVDSAGINAFMNKITYFHSTRIWLGGFQDDLSGKWTWTDGSVINPGYWGDGEPNTEAEKCIELYTGSKSLKRKWNDVHCTYNGIPMFVCQLHLKEEPNCLQ